VKLPQTLNNVKSAVLISAEMPSTYYVFTAAKGTTSLRVTVNTTTATVTIPDGNYTTTTMAAALKTALEAAFAGTTFTVTFDPATYRCTISISPSNTLTVECTSVTRGASARVTVGNTTKTVTIADGNYTIATMQTAWKAALEAAFAGSTFTVTIDPVTYICTIAISPSNTLIANLASFTESTDWWGMGLGNYLGFARNVATTGTATITGSLASNMNPELYYLIDITELNAVDETAVGGRRGAFAKVPLQAGISQNSFYSTILACFMCNEQKPPKARLDKLSVSIRFRDGTLVDFNDAEHSMTIELVCTETTFH
jgi:phage baseplate assembly protein gpV